MNKIFITLSLSASLFVSAQYHGFSYTGALNGNSWVRHSGTENETQALTTPSESGNSLNYSGIAAPQGNRALLTSANTEDLNLAFSQAVTTTAYVSFLMKITDTGSLSSNTVTTPPGYFMHFSPASGTSLGSTGWVSRLSLRKGSAANTFNMGILNTTGGVASMADVYGTTTPTDYQAGVTYLVVLKYDMTGTSGQTSLWINPAISAEGTPLHSSNFGNSTKLTQVESVAVRQANNIGSIEIDELRLGTSWADVVGNALSTSDFKETNSVLISNTVVQDHFRVLVKNKSFVEIFSVAGNIVKRGSFNYNQEVNVSELIKGVYFVKITNDHKSSVVKIIKK